MINVDYASPETLIETINEKKEIFFKKDEIIFSENEPASGIYLIKEGKVKIVKSGFNNENKILFFAGSGDFLGLHSVINGIKYSNSAIAIEKTDTCFVEREEFLKTLESDINKKLLVMKFLCSRIENMESQISSISDKSAAGRLAESFLFLLETYGTTKNGFVNISLSAEDMANLTGTSKGYLVKIISEFSSNNWIYMEGSSFKILDKEKLKAISES